MQLRLNREQSNALYCYAVHTEGVVCEATDCWLAIADALAAGKRPPQSAMRDLGVHFIILRSLLLTLRAEAVR